MSFPAWMYPSVTCPFSSSSRVPVAVLYDPKPPALYFLGLSPAFWAACGCSITTMSSGLTAALVSRSLGCLCHTFGFCLPLRMRPSSQTFDFLCWSLVSLHRDLHCPVSRSPVLTPIWNTGVSKHQVHFVILTHIYFKFLDKGFSWWGRRTSVNYNKQEILKIKENINKNKTSNPGRSASNMELLRGWTVGSCHVAPLYVTLPRPPYMLWCERKTGEPGEPQTARPWGRPLPRGHFQPIAETVESKDSSVLPLSIRRLKIGNRGAGETRLQLTYNTGTQAGTEDRTCEI